MSVMSPPGLYAEPQYADVVGQFDRQIMRRMYYCVGN
jgi:hypothetical protein